MKLIPVLVCVALSSLTAKADTLTFDDLAPGDDYAIIRNGYGGLQWYTFDVINGLLSSGGYSNGVVSSSNVAFNVSGYPASFSRTNSLFDFNSAYLTSSFAQDCRVRVEGFSGPKLAYDNTYALYLAAPLLIHFNYTNVNRVVFLPVVNGNFAMDNPDVVIHETAIPHVAVDLGEVETPTIGHWFQPFVRPDETTRGVADYLVDQGHITTGGALLPSASIDWDNYDQFTLRIAAPQGYEFLVRVPIGHSVQLFGSLTWDSTGGGSGPAGAVAISFDESQGAIPGLSEGYAALADSRGFFMVGGIASSAFTNDIAFSSITLTGTVTAQHTGGGPLTFDPALSSDLDFRYATSETNDPGSFVSIVPIRIVPYAHISSLSETGIAVSVEARSGTTNGT